jgi:phosphoglycolate phosphatase
MRSNKIQHIIWDWNGTLINDAWLFVELMNEELVIRNLPLITIEKYRENFTFPVKKYYQNLGFDFNKEDFKEVGYNFIQKFIKRRLEPKLFPDTKKILSQLKKLNISQSIISAQEHQLLNQTIKDYQIHHYFSSVSGIKHYYADSKIQLAKEERKKIDLKNSNIIMIGDSIHDYEVAKELNIKCLLFANGHYSKKRLLKTKNNIINDLSELLKYL